MPETIERTAANVVTSENLAEFMTERLDLAKPAPGIAPDSKAEEKPEVAPDPDEPKPNATEEEKQGSYRKLRARAQAAETEREALKAEREALTKERDELRARAPAPAPQQEANPKPDPTKYTDQAKFDEDMLDWRVNEAIRKRDAEAAKERAKVEKEATLRGWQARIASAEKAIPDFKARMEAAGDAPIHSLIEQAIYESDIGTELLLHLAENKVERDALNAMPPAKMMREFGKLETRLEKPKEAPKAALELVKPKPEPLEPLKGGSVPGDAIGPDGEFRGTPAEYRALRKAGKIK